ncbi:hypothetical protein P3T73_09405 [Kiritimatiellota bacterium B12222]|nr:hypothetical protein P3T73_09405 [Kiritimatiellota bacterium B12222]
MLTPRPPLDSHPKRMFEMMLFAMLAFGLTLWISGQVFSNQLLLSEEGNALFQAGNFLDGTHSRNPQGYTELVEYDSMTILPNEDWKSRFAPGHPFWLVPGVWMGWPQVMTAISAMVTMIAVYGIGWRLRMPRFLMPILLLASPFFLFLHGTLLPQTSGMLFASLFLLGYLKWRQERSLLWAFLCGFCWSALLQIRPLSATFILIPFMVDTLLELKRNRKEGRSWAGIFLFLIACSLGVWAVLRYNQVSTGDPFLVTYLEHEPSEKWGFGERRTQGGDVDMVHHTLIRGWILLWQNLRELDAWMLGTFPATLLLWFLLGVHGWSRRWSGVLFGVLMSVMFGYMAFWDDGRSIVGPLHYAELLPFLLLFGGLGLSRIWRKMQEHHLRRCLLFTLFSLIGLYFSVPFSLSKAQEIQKQNASSWKIAKLVNALPENSLVFLPSEVRENETLRANLALNVKGWDSSVLRLQAEPDDRRALAVSFSDRQAYELILEPNVDLNQVPAEWSAPTRLANNSHHSRQTSRNQGTDRVADAENDLPGYLFYGWYPYLPPGIYECRFDLRWSNVEQSKPLRLEVMADLGQRSLGHQILAEGLDETVIRFVLTEALQVEPRVYFGGSGSVTLREVSLTKITPEVSSTVLQSLLQP